MTGGKPAARDDRGPYRKRAPGNPADHPDWILSLSGGVDSVAAALVATDALRSTDDGGNYAKAPVAIYLDTRTGAPLNRQYVEQLADWLDVQLWTLRTDEKFEAWLRRDGAPGSGAHQYVRNELKDRQVSKLTTMAAHPVYVLGLAADESETRAEFPKARVLRRHTEVYPVHRLTRKDRVEIVLRSGCPINTVSWEQQRNELEERYGNPREYARRLEVDHIQPITDGGHPFDPGNLQTLCSDCHTEITSTEASQRAETSGRNELNQSLFEHVATGGGNDS